MSYLGPIGFSESKLENACEFHGDSYISHTPSVAASDLQMGTVSLWWRWAKWDGTSFLFAASENSTNETFAYFSSSSGFLRVQNVHGGSTSCNWIGTDDLRDNDWHHLCIRFDLTNATRADRFVVEIDGVQKSVEADAPSTDSTELGGLFNTNSHEVGYSARSGGYFHGVLGDVQLINAQALAASNFGKTVDSAWVWKNYTGAHSSNGLRLEFKNSADLGENTAV
jgi:hypothetical protein